MTATPPPYGCAVCGIPQSVHGRRFDAKAGMHQWVRPTEKQIKQRMQARRAERKKATR